jgi:hypothetical protein
VTVATIDRDRLGWYSGGLVGGCVGVSPAFDRVVAPDVALPRADVDGLALDGDGDGACVLGSGAVAG